MIKGTADHIYSLFQDIRVGIRNLIKKPGFTFIAVLTLALGSGANTAIFSVVNGLMFRPQPVPDASQLVSLTARLSTVGFNHSLSYPDFRDYRAMSQVFEDATTCISGFVQLTAQGIPERVLVTYTTSNYFSTLGLNPGLGSFYQPQSSEFKGQRHVVLSHSYWASHFASQPNIMGQKISLNGLPVTISGVTPAEFSGTDGFTISSLYVPLNVWLQIEPNMKSELDDRSGFSWRATTALNLFGAPIVRN